MREREIDAPLHEIMKNAIDAERQGYIVFQKWTCAKCGSRQTMPDAYKFYTSGECEECHHVTDIRRCGYTAIHTGTPRPDPKLIDIMETALRRGDDPPPPKFELATCVFHGTQYALELGACPLCVDEERAGVTYDR